MEKKEARQEIRRRIRALTPDERETMDEDSALAAILSQPTLIKRPLLDTGQQRSCGFSAAQYQSLFNLHTL